MKFAHSFTEELQTYEYPSEWVDAAIRYRQLKKCIKKVQREMVELGLAPDMLKMLAKEKDGNGGDYHHGNGVAMAAKPGLGIALRNTEPTSELHEDVSLNRRNSIESKSSDSSGMSSSVDEEYDAERDWEDCEQNSAEPECHKGDEDPRGQGIKFSYWFDGPSLSLLLLSLHSVSEPSIANIPPYPRAAE